MVTLFLLEIGPLCTIQIFRMPRLKFFCRYDHYFFGIYQCLYSEAVLLFKASKSVQPSRAPFRDAHGRDSELSETNQVLPKSKGNELAQPSKNSDVPQQRSSRFYGTPTRKISTEKSVPGDSAKSSDSIHSKTVRVEVQPSPNK